MSMPSLHPVLPATRNVPLHDTAGSRAIEQRAAAALPPHMLMARAGDAVARLALAVAPHARRIAVCCGPGNNGGDGLIAAAHLHRAQREVTVSLVGDAGRLPPDAANALRQARDAGVHISEGVPPTIEAELVIDALLGLGADRPLQGAIAQAVTTIGSLAAPVLAVDLPTGLHGETGTLLGTAAVRATHTLALLTCKPGLFTAHARDHAGRIWFDDLGCEPDPEVACAWLHGEDRVCACLPERGHAQHKGSFGNVAVIGGAPGMVGAAALAARAALAAGAGRVYVGAIGASADTHDSARPELMWRAPSTLLQPAALADTTVVCGCGGGSAIGELLPPLLHHATRIVVDADALNLIGADAGLRRALAARGARGLATIVTPHPLEAARLLDSDIAAVQADRLASARQLAESLAACVVLKGSGTIVAAPGIRPHINATGNARLATAGTGDVLAGWIGGLWSAAGATAQPLDVAAAAVWLHGRAAEPARRHGPLLAADLIDAMVAAADACAETREEETLSRSAFGAERQRLGP